MPDPWTEAMLQGEFERAWTISDRVMRRRRGQSCADLPRHLCWVWDGTPLAGRNVLLRCYHGLGDTLQFIRFVPRLAAIARAVIVEAQPRLLPLLGSVCAGADLRPLDAALPSWDVAIESMELPHALRIGLTNLPGPIPYLTSPEPRIARLHPCPGRDRRERLQIGLVWAAGDWRRERSVPAPLLLPLTRLPIDLVGLQLGPARDAPEAAGLIGALDRMIPENATAAETATLIGGLDLMISVDTMVAHLAGALGRPVWVLLDADADWRWMRGRSNSPWYPTMRLFRQTRPGDWRAVVERVAAALSLEAGRTSRPDQPERDLPAPC